jgi:hypothetical protein
MYKIYYLDDFNEELNDENWSMLLDISTLWNEYESKKIDMNAFIEKFNDFLKSKRNKISKVSTECLTSLNKLIEECDIKNDDDFYKYIDSIYDWADENNINIKCKVEKKNEAFSTI